MTLEVEVIGGVTAADPRLGSAPRPPDLRLPARRSESRADEPQTVPTRPLEDVGLVFEVSRDGRDLVIKIVDRESHRVLRQIPPEEVQRIRAAMQELVGLLLDQTG